VIACVVGLWGGGAGPRAQHLMLVDGGGSWLQVTRDHTPPLAPETLREKSSMGSSLPPPSPPSSLSLSLSLSPSPSLSLSPSLPLSLSPSLPLSLPPQPVGPVTTDRLVWLLMGCF
jgi:hypothetical protein